MSLSGAGDALSAFVLDVSCPPAESVDDLKEHKLDWQTSNDRMGTDGADLAE